jgi:hypothetical protein
MNKRDERIDRLKAVELEFETAKAAIDRVERLLKDEPRQARVMGIELPDLRKVSKNLVRAFGTNEFMSGT